jgi:hypothetical protein
MPTSTSDRLTPATAEQLLDGGAGPARLHRLLAAAAAPGTPEELAGEAAAVAAFVDARRTSPSGPPRQSTLGTALSKILAAKAVAAVVLLAGATGGVALAATVSGPLSPPQADPPAATSPPKPAPSAAAGDHPGPEAQAPAGWPHTTPPASPQPSLASLCPAWTAGDADDPTFGSLVEAAGSPGQVPGYCADLAGTDQRARPSTTPGRDGDRRQGSPGDAPDATTHPEVPPTSAPGNPDHQGNSESPFNSGSPGNGNPGDADHPAGPPTGTERRGTGERDSGAAPAPGDQGQDGG